MSDGVWLFSYRVSSELPPLFWIARVCAPAIEVDCGASVRTSEAGFLEGTWAGPPNMTAAAQAATVFATGIVLTPDGPVVITPSHSQEGVYSVHDGDTTLISNSLAGLLQRTGLRPDPRIAYPSVFVGVGDLKWLVEQGGPPSVAGHTLAIPTTDAPVAAHFYENQRVTPDGNLRASPKPRERTFESFADYRDRITAAVAQLFENGAPYEPVVALSAGYDSTAVAAVAAQVGLRRAVGFRTARQEHAGTPTDDRGSMAARVLGLELELFERMAYVHSEDLTEAEFLAGGMSGEDVVMSNFEPALAGRLLLTGHWGGLMWAERAARPPRPLRRLPQADLSGCSMTDFRLRANFLHVPLPFFGALQRPRASTFPYDADMHSYRVGGRYDRPIPRRLAEEAGVPRDAFARRKVAVSSLLHRDGRAAFAPATLAAIERYAESEGDALALRPTFRTLRRHRALIAAAHRAGLGRLTGGLESRRRAGTHFEGATGTLLFRWALSVVGPRYAASEIESGGSRDSPRS